MALKSCLWPWRLAHRKRLSGSAEGFSQTLLIAHAALQRITKHRQLVADQAEAGGQLFGTVEPSLVRILMATGPYKKDERGRFHYRSDPNAAHTAIKSQAGRQLLYLGEWHTHAEPIPRLSNDDLNAIRTLLVRSSLNINGVFLLVCGQLPPPHGLAAWSFDGSSFMQWQVTVAKEG